MSEYATWTATDWLAHYAGPRFAGGTSCDEHGRRVPGPMMLYGAGAAPAKPRPEYDYQHRPHQARLAEDRETGSPSSSLKPILLLGAIGAGWYFFGPQIRAAMSSAPSEASTVTRTATEKATGLAKGAAEIAGRAAGHVSRFSEKVSDKTRSLSQRATKYAAEGD